MHFEIWQHNLSAGNMARHDIRPAWTMFTQLPDIVDLKASYFAWNKTYEGILGEDGNPFLILNELYELFNICHPADFKSYSLSVGDMVKLDKEWYACDDIGWRKITVTEEE